MRASVQVPGLQPNANYAIQIRGVNDDGVGQWSSQLVFSTEVDQVAPNPVTALSVDVDGPDFLAKWTAPTTSADGSTIDDLRDYKVVIEGSGGAGGTETTEFYTTDTSFALPYTLNRNRFSNPKPTVQFTVQARDRVGNLSTAVSSSATNPAPDAPVLSSAAKRNGVELTWDDVFDDDGKVFEIHKNSLLYATVAPGTLIWTDTDVGEGGQNYLVRAIDLFGQATDSNTRFEGEITIEVDTDEIAPKPPTNAGFVDSVTGPEGFVTLSWDAPVQDTDNTSYTDQEGYEVRYRFATSRPWTYFRVPDLRVDGSTAENVEVDVDNVPAGVDFFWEVRAFDRSYNYSSWLISSDSVAADTTPPAVPTGLSVSGGLRTIIASWTPNTEDDLAGYRVYASTSASVAQNAGNLKFDGLGTSTSWSANDDETWYVIVVAYDVPGNTSTASTEESATTIASVTDTTPPSNVAGLTLSKRFYYHGSSQFASITATWTAATDDEGMFGYVVAWQNADAGVVATEWVEEVVADQTKFTLTGIDLVYESAGVDEDSPELIPATYAFRVKAIDQANNTSSAWSATETITIDDDGEAPRGEVRREVPITFDGALQSDNFVNLLRGFRLSERTLEIYGDADHDVSILLGRGGEGLNLSTINDQMWFGSQRFENATWRVGIGGDMRVGGPGAIGERILDITNLLLESGDGVYEVFYDTATPTASGNGDLWSDGLVTYQWDGAAWVDIERPIVANQIYALVDELLAATGSLDFYIGSVNEPGSPVLHDIWYNDSDAYLYTADGWENMLDVNGAFYASAAGDVWSGDADFFEAPWSISRAGRAVMRNVRIQPNADVPDESDILYVSSSTDAPLLVIRKHDIDNWSFRVGMDMFVEAGGHLQLAGGDISLTSGNITLDGGDFTMSGGTLNLTGTPVLMDGSDFTIESGNIRLVGGDAASALPDGAIMSDDYDYSTRTGWALDSGNLYLFSGEINAALVDIKNQQNLLEYGYTTFLYNEEWYAENLQESGLVASLTSIWSRYGSTALRLVGDTGDTVEFYQDTGVGPDYNRVRVDGGSSYIFSAYVRNVTAGAKDIELFITQSTGAPGVSEVFTIPAETTQRISGVFTMESSATGVLPGIRLKSAGADFIVDGAQFELKEVDSDTPSTFNIGGSTRIDAGSIQTGSITSNNYLTGVSGFEIKMDGTVEFQGGVFRGQLFAEDLVSDTIENQDFILSKIESFVPDPGFENGWSSIRVLASS
ncbi:MAG: fibronectin type III domain-containing protein [Actinobacteria bacterium]|nr:fibronectin type III domain-containing protein [Actinomycetota bacterium]